MTDPTEIEVPNQTRTETLVEAGREMGRQMLHGAIVSATNPQMMAHQIFTLQVASGYIAANCAFNAEKQEGVDGEKYVDNFCADVKLELQALRAAAASGEMELAQPGVPATPDTMQ